MSPKKKKTDVRGLLDSLGQLDDMMGGLEADLKKKRSSERRKASEVVSGESVLSPSNVVNAPSAEEAMPRADEVVAVYPQESSDSQDGAPLDSEVLEGSANTLGIDHDGVPAFSGEPGEGLQATPESEGEPRLTEVALVPPVLVELEVPVGGSEPPADIALAIPSVSSDYAEPAWLADLESIEASSEGVVLEVVEDDELKDVLDIEPAMLSIAMAEAEEELIPVIESCLDELEEQQKPGVIQELDRRVHTLKGVAGMVGGMRTRALLHRMENLTIEIREGRTLDRALLDRLRDMFARARKQLDELFHPSAATDSETEGASHAGRVKNVRVSTELLDRLYNETNEARLSGESLVGQVLAMRGQLREMDDTISRIGQLARDFEIQAETQIQSKRAQLAESHEGFDPLEMDRFNQLQEMARLLAEAAGDIQDQQKDLVRTVLEQETGLAYQGRSITQVQDGLYQSRLVVVDTELNDVLHKVALNTAKELDKSVSFSLMGGEIPLDRALLNRVREPLNHIIRNAVAHGIETAEVRQAAGKPATGSLRLAIQKEAGRAIFVVEDDGAGLNVDRIRAKAIEKNLWKPEKPMDAKQAADMICLPGFSTADKVSQVAGRGVGMDVVRNDVLAMGGRFDLSSRTGRGLRVVLQIPTTVAAASVLMVEAGGETWSIPIEIIRDVAILKGEVLENARRTGEVELLGETLPFASLDRLMGAFDPSALPQDSAPVLLLKEGERQVVVETSRLSQVAELPLRTLGSLWSKTPGIIGATLLPDGRASFLVDPLRAPWEQESSPLSPGSDVVGAVVRPPMVLVVDDSVTVRKATARFLERVGYEPYLAKDGQEALEALAQIQPAAMLLDVEMPRMNGFDCARNVRENPRYADLPIIMITSRMAEKHRERARSLGINEFLGKPFQEDELLSLLQQYIEPQKH